MRPDRPRIDSSALSSRRSLLLLVPVCVTVIGAIAPLALHAGGLLQGPTELFLPSLQSELRLDGNDVVVMGQEGFGATMVEVQNLSDSPNDIRLELAQQTGGEPTSLGRRADAMAVARFDLDHETSLEGGYYAGRLSGSGPLGALARIRWPSGAVAAYEAAPAARDFILPLVARAVYSHTTIIYGQNADPGADDNAMDMVIYDRDDGAVQASTTCHARTGENCTWDTSHASWVFGPDLVGTNAPEGGWLGHAWIHTSHSASVMAYGDEMAAQGTSAHLGRPIAAAATTQYAPLLRANHFGDSLLAIANAHDRAVDVTIEYRGAPFSAGGAGETFSQSFSIARRGSAFVDLSDRGRGSRPSPSLPRGGAPNEGFIGSAVITASGPVLAVVQDEQMASGVVDSVSAYNAYGPADFGSAFRVTGVRKELGYQSTSALVYNPGSEPIEVTADLYDSADVHAGKATTQIPGRDVARIALAEAATFAPGVGRAVVEGTGAFAMLAYDERDDQGQPLEMATTAYLASVGETPMSGSAKFLEVDGGVRVDLALSFTIENWVYYAEIARGTCDGTRETAYDLEDPVDRKSTTNIRNVRLADLTETPHCVVISVQGYPGRPPRDVACGVIPPLPGPEIVDTAISWPVRVAEAGPPASPTPPGATATATSTPKPGVGPYNALLPITHRY